MNITKAWAAIRDFVLKKNNTIVQAVGTTIGLGQLLNWWSLSPEQIGAILTAIPVYFLLIGAQTVTSNVRLTGKVWGGPNGVTASDVAANTENNVVELPGSPEGA